MENSNNVIFSTPGQRNVQIQVESAIFTQSEHVKTIIVILFPTQAFHVNTKFHSQHKPSKQ